MKQQDIITKEFNELYESQTDALFRYCFFRMSDREQAKDIIQEAFTRVWDTQRRGVEVKNLRALLFKITSNLIIDWYRKKKAVSLDSMMEANEGDQGLQVSDDSFEQIEIQSEGKMLIQYIGTLETTYQQVVYLRFVDDLSPKEIAEIVSLSVNVVSVRINRGIEILKKKYEK